MKRTFPAPPLSPNDVGTNMVAQKIAAPSLTNLLRTVIEFDDGVFSKIELLLQNATPLASAELELEEIASEFDLGVDDLRYFVAFVTYLYSELDGLDKRDVRSTIVEYLTEQEIEDPDGGFAEKITNLLGYRQQHEQGLKRDRLTKGFLPFLVGTSSFVDRRADFFRNDNDELTGLVNSYVTVAQLMLFTDASNEADRTFIVQLDRNATEKLIKTLQEVLEKITIVEGGA